MTTGAPAAVRLGAIQGTPLDTQNCASVYIGVQGTPIECITFAS
jgi:hypothetical protein